MSLEIRGKILTKLAGTKEIGPSIEVNPITEISVPGLPEKYYVTNHFTNTYKSQLYKGFDLETGEEIAIKKCLYDLDFQREAAAYTKIFSKGGSQHILPYYACIPGGYIVMPFMEDGMLWDLRKKKKGLSPEEAFDMTAQIGKALEQVHAMGVIHNDIKSGNVLLDASNGKYIAKLTDFGFSSCGIPALEPDWGDGTLQYNAPEKLRDEGELTPAVDIFSLGMILHEILTDTLFYQRNSRQVRTFPPDKKIPDKVLPVLRTACAFDPKDRYRTVTEMVSDLERAVYQK